MFFRLVPGLAITALGLAALVFLPTGRWDWSAGWAYSLLNGAILFAAGGVLYRYRPQLLAKRMTLSADTPTWDYIILIGLCVSVQMVHAVAALDRGRVAQNPPSWVWSFGFVLMLGGALVVLWSMLANPYFETTVCYQEKDRHQVITSGPYSWVRHPGYTGGLAYLLATCLMLGSFYAVFAWALAALFLLLRTELEEQLLKQYFEEYSEYQTRVQHRLLPGTERVKGFETDFGFNLESIRLVSRVG